jgi:glycine/D-amino acid oxidase-like deaminating enzyme
VGERPGGKPLSLWVATAGSTKYASLDADIDVDVAVIEAARVGTGVTGHTSGKVTSLHRLAYTELAGSHGEAAARTYGQANQAATEHIARTVSGEGLDCGFRRVSNYTYAETDGALGRVRDEAALAARLGLPSVFTSDAPLPFPVKGAVRFDGQAQIHAVKYLQGLAGAVHGGGSFVFEESAAVSLQDGSPTAVNTERGSVRARDVIVATNVPFGDRGGFEARCYPHRSYLTASCLATGQGLDDAFSNSTFIGVDEPNALHPDRRCGRRPVRAHRG